MKHQQIYAKVTYPRNPTSILFSTRLIIAGALLVTPFAYAAEPEACYAPPPPVDVDNALTEINLDDPEAVFFEVGQLEAALGDPPSASMTGGVLLRQGDRLAGAESATYEPVNQSPCGKRSL